MRGFFIIIICLLSYLGFTQNKMGYTWIVGNNASYGQFDGTATPPQVGSVYTQASPNFPYIFGQGQSNISDSATGKLVFLCNGYVLYDTLGNIIQNGDSLVPEKIYTHNAYPASFYTQSSIILPKGNNGLFYIFTPTLSDSAYNFFVTNGGGGGKVPFDLLLYHVLDMNANGGAGKVIEKNKKLLSEVELSKVMMQACRHSNGVDWWLLKQGRYGTNEIYRFLVTKDSIYGPYIQTFVVPKFDSVDLWGQMAFSADGTKFASAGTKVSKLFLADFDRCTGELANPQVFNIPRDSTSYPQIDNYPSRDTITAGICFSSNGQFIYITKLYNIYQYEYGEADSALAWFNVKRGGDTTYLAFEMYGQLLRGPNGRIYIGKQGGSLKQFSVIDNPDIKGTGCNFCRKCFRVDSALGGLNSPPNMPDYELGPNGVTCWPLQNEEFLNLNSELDVYPNPASDKLYIRNVANKKKEFYNMVGTLVYSTLKDEIEISNFAKGVYFIRCDGKGKKVIIE